jgi:hypothetical protein
VVIEVLSLGSRVEHLAGAGLLVSYSDGNRGQIAAQLTLFITGAIRVACWCASCGRDINLCMSWWPESGWLRALDLGAHVKRRDLSKLWKRAITAPPWLVFLGGLVVGGAVVAAVTWKDMPAASIGLVGVLVGATISAGVAWIVALEARRVQIGAATSAKRLQAHQEAFAIWHQCWDVVHEQDQDKKSETLERAQEWWLNNCLYLSDEARDAFRRMIMSASAHSGILERNLNRSREEWRKELDDNWARIETTGQIIVRGSGSHIADDVIKRLAPPRPDTAR